MGGGEVRDALHGHRREENHTDIVPSLCYLGWNKHRPECWVMCTPGLALLPTLYDHSRECESRSRTPRAFPVFSTMLPYLSPNWKFTVSARLVSQGAPRIHLPPHTSLQYWRCRQEPCLSFFVSAGFLTQVTP